MNARRPLMRSRRGQPLMVLVLIVLAWCGMRIVTWSEPFAMPKAASRVHSGMARSAGAGAPIPVETSPGEAQIPDSLRLRLPVDPRGFGDPLDWQAPPVSDPSPSISDWPRPALDARNPDADQALLTSPPVPSRLVAGHTMLMAAGFAQMEVPPHLLRYFTAASGPVANDAEPAQPSERLMQAAPLAVPFAEEGQGARRWSADGWLLWRDDSTTPLLAGGRSYGRSQVGAVVRYQLAPSGNHRPQAYLRGSAALQGAREAEAAVGLSARPLPRIPVRLAAEVRVADRATGSEVRPAAYAVTELPRVALPAGLTGEVYLQGGYVGGDFATAFVDGQVRVDRRIAGADDVQLRAGAAMWGGAQDDAARLDVGPSAALTFRLGETRGRLAADYRFRVAGEATPASGPALTLSAGF